MASLEPKEKASLGEYLWQMEQLGQRPWDENDLGTVRTPKGQGGWSTWVGKRVVQDTVREVNKTRSGFVEITIKVLNLIPQNGKGHWRALSKLV